MTTSLLAVPRELCDTPTEARLFEQNRRPASFVDLVELVEASFELRDADWGSLFHYVMGHPATAAVLAEASAAIRRVFGDVRPMLDLVNDPEEGWEKLFVVIPTDRPAESAIDAMTRLDAARFAEAERRAGFSVGITVE